MRHLDRAAGEQCADGNTSDGGMAVQPGKLPSRGQRGP